MERMGRILIAAQLRAEARRNLQAALNTPDPDVCDGLIEKALELLERARNLATFDEDLLTDRRNLGSAPAFFSKWRN